MYLHRKQNNFCKKHPPPNKKKQLHKNYKNYFGITINKNVIAKSFYPTENVVVKAINAAILTKMTILWCDYNVKNHFDTHGWMMYVNCMYTGYL